MVTINRLTTVWKGISEDSKPLDNVRNGSKYFEMDTQRLLYFDEEHHAWIIFSSPTDPTSGEVGIGAVGYMKVSA